MKRLGASQVFDYNKPGVIDEVIAALDANVNVGILDAVSTNGAIEACLEISSKAKGDVFVSTVRPVPEDQPSGVQAKSLYVTDIKENEVGKAIFGHFIPQALSTGKFVAAPDPYVVGKGLEHVQTGMDLLKGGMSAKKVVITL